MRALRNSTGLLIEVVKMVPVDHSVQLNTAPLPTEGPIVRDAAPCFTAATRIITNVGEKLIEDITVDDLVLTADHGFQPVRWTGHRDVTRVDLTRYPQLRPIVVEQGTFGNSRRLRVSPEHGILARIEDQETLIRAKNVASVMGPQTAYPDFACETVTYFHLMCDQHELIFAEGTLTEAFFPTPSAMGSLDTGPRDELLLLFIPKNQPPLHHP